MAKIVVYEDLIFDVESRYNSLFRDHDVTVCMIDFSEYAIRESGLPLRNFREFTETDPVDEADLYFLDGLGGYWKELIKRLPREKTVLTSDEPAYQHQATQMGIRVARSASEIAAIANSV